ncbi:MAG: DUF3379 family protein [Pseudomonadota bacterium]|nr:DUF3379 family protein [Pseudomonadota bacterium]
MNCEYFRQQCLLDPNCQEQAFYQHKRICPQCAHFSEEILAFEHQLTQVIEVEPSADLNRRIIKHVAGPIWQQPRFYLSLVASLVLGVLLLFWFQSHPLELTPLQQTMLSVIQHDLPSIDNLTTEVSPQEQAQMFQLIGAKQVASLGKINACGALNVAAYQGAWMIIPGTQESIKVFFIRDQKIYSEQHFVSEDLKGIIKPMGRNSLAVIGHIQERELNRIARRIKHAIQWS